MNPSKEDVIEYALDHGCRPEWCPFSGHHWIRCPSGWTFKATGTRIIRWEGSGDDPAENARVIAAIRLGTQRVPCTA